MASRRFGVIATMLFLCALLPPAFLASAQGRWTRIFYLKGKQYGIGLKEAEKDGVTSCNVADDALG